VRYYGLLVLGDADPALDPVGDQEPPGGGGNDDPASATSAAAESADEADRSSDSVARSQ